LTKPAIWLLLLSAISIFCHPTAQARDLTASVAFIPLHSEQGRDGAPHGGFIELIRAMDNIYIDGNITIEQYPFKRSINNVLNRSADFHIPLVKLDHIPEESLPFAYASKPITKVSFVLYTRTGQSSSVLQNPRNHSIETQRGHEHFFPFPVSGTDSVRQGIRKVLSGRSDGFIMEQEAVDDHIRKNKFKTIERALYATWDSCFVIAKEEKGKQLDGILSELLQALEDSGQLKQITDTIHQPYLDWQPVDMGW